MVKIHYFLVDFVCSLNFFVLKILKGEGSKKLQHPIKICHVTKKETCQTNQIVFDYGDKSVKTCSKALKYSPKTANVLSLSLSNVIKRCFFRFLVIFSS